MVDFAFTEHEESLNDLTSLCRSQMIQRVIAPLLLQFHVRPERYAEFLRTHSAEILQIYESPEIPPAQWNDQLIEAMGASDLPAESKQQHLMNLQVSIRNNSSLRGTPQQWIRLMAELIEFCMPRGYDEWYQFAQLVFSVEELRADLLMITNAVHFALASSVEARHVAFDIHRLVDHNPVEAFARCMHWVTQFLAYTETAWPKTSEINEFGVSRRRRMEEENASQQAILATFLICDATYQGKLTSRGNAEHPFAYLLRHKLADYSDRSALLIEIDSAGETFGVCVADQSAGCPVEGQPARSRDRTGIILDFEKNVVLSIITDYVRTNNGVEPTSSEIKTELRNRAMSLGNGKVQKILDDLREAKKYHIPGRPRKLSRTSIN